MGKFGIVLLVIVLGLLGVTGLGAAGPQRIGIVQIVEHPALDSAREGFLAGLAASGFGEADVTVDFRSAQGDFSTAAAISQQFVSNRMDLILAIATPTAQAAAYATDSIPVMFTAVTDPIAAGLVDSIEVPGANVTGTSDMTPVAGQLELLLQLAPNAKRVGVLYNPGEVNSVVQVDLAQVVADALGLTLVKGGVNSSAEVYQAAQALVGRVDALYVPTDNTVASAIQSVIMVAEDAKLPLVVGEDTMVLQGALATVGINYYNLGYQTGIMAAQVLNGADPATMPVGYQKDLALVINLQAAEKMGVVVSDDLKASADQLITD